jgi:uncharacterized coiled-coil DUF342 family protein
MNPMMITEKISEDAKSAISQHIMMFNKTMQEWQTKMSCDMMDMIQRDKIDTTGVSEELKRVWTQLSEGLNMLHKNTMELQSKFALAEAEKNQLREHVQQGSQERASIAQEITNIKSKLDEFSKRFDIVHETYRGLSRQLSYHENVLNHQDKSGRPDIGEGLMQAITQLREEVNMLKSKSAADDREIGLLKRKVDMQNAAIQSQITCIEGLVASDLRHQECHADLSSYVKKQLRNIQHQISENHQVSGGGYPSGRQSPEAVATSSSSCKMPHEISKMELRSRLSKQEHASIETSMKSGPIGSKAHGKDRVTHAVSSTMHFDEKYHKDDSEESESSEDDSPKSSRPDPYTTEELCRSLIGTTPMGW